MNIITRFAPSPTGYLHIGGARTAIFNYLFARKHNGKFLLRIEDTDRARSTDEATAAIINGLDWLGIEHDGEIVYQYSRAERHLQVAKELVAKGAAYYCFTPQEEINQLREAAIARKESFIFSSPWRDAHSNAHPHDSAGVIRIKAPRSGDTVINDLVQGPVTTANDHLDDMILVRSDGTPTYMLAVVVDDHDMGITHIIRGDDHLNNAARQYLIYKAMGWDVPEFAHIPLIHGPDGAKLSKRHGALGIESYKDMGYLPEALNNYLLRLGWSHGNDEIISRTQAIEWFNIEHIGKSPSRLDFDKMRNLNAHYIKEADNTKLTDEVVAILSKEYIVNEVSRKNIFDSMDSLKTRAKLLTDLADNSIFLLTSIEIKPNEDAQKIIDNCDTTLIQEVIKALSDLNDFTLDNIKVSLNEIAATKSMKIGELMNPLRALLTGRTNSHSVFEIISVLGQEITIARLNAGL